MRPNVGGPAPATGAATLPAAHPRQSSGRGVPSFDLWGSGTHNPPRGSTSTPKTPKPPKTPVATTPAVDPNAWAYKPPPDVQTLLRQLAANAGQQFMPMGPGGDVRTPAFGSGGVAETNVDPAHYGETGGETNFFTTTQKGGMAPIWSAPGSLPGWDPLGLLKQVQSTAKPAAQQQRSDRTAGGPGAARTSGANRRSSAAPAAAPAATASSAMTPEQLMALLATIFPTQ